MQCFHSMPWEGIQRCPWKPIGGGIQRAIKWWSLLGSTNHRICWIQDIGIVLGVALYSSSMDKGSFFGQFWKLGFFLVIECPIFAHRGQICKFLNHERVPSITTWNLPKCTCMTHQNPILMHGFHSMPRVGIEQVSVKAGRRWDSMYDRMMVVTRIDEPSNLLNSWHQDSVSGGPLLQVHG